jgi:hypothetical protein
MTAPAVTDNRLSMELPTVSQPWPPVQFNPVTWDQRTWQAWWSGDPDALMRAYYSLGANSPLGRSYFATTGESGMPTPRPGQFRGGLIGSIRRWFWGQPTPPGEKRTNYHVPIAGDIAATSASLLFSKPPSLSYDDTGAEAPSALQEYLEGLIDDGLHSTLLESAEQCAALGGVFLRVVWDTDLADHPWIDVVPADAAVPEFRYGRLVAVTFWRVVEDTGSSVLRHLEKHIPSQNAILHGLYAGDQKVLGRPIPLTDHPDTAPIAPMITDGGNRITFPDQPKDASTVVYVPNIRPNRIWRDLGPQVVPLGRSDYSGVEGLMDALDETLSSWMRDIRLGKARLMVPPSFLDNIGRGKGAVFEPDREVFVPLNLLVNGSAPPGAMITPNQFNIRYVEHQQTANTLIEQIINQAGYSSQTFGMIGDVAATATEIEARERKSLITRAKKINYWRPALQDIIYGLLSIENTVFGRKDLEPARPTIDFGDVVLPNEAEIAQTVATLRAAEAMSIERAVAEVHPDWDPDEVTEEVSRIYHELGADLISQARVELMSPQDATLGQDVSQLAGDEDDLPSDSSGGQQPRPQPAQGSPDGSIRQPWLRRGAHGHPHMGSRS